MENSFPSKMRATKYIGLYLGIIVVIFSFGVGVVVGQTAGSRKGPGVGSASTSVAATEVYNLDRSVNHADTVDFNQFWDVWDRVKSKYIKKPVKDVDLFYGSIQGLVASLGDPYSVYFPPQAATEFNKSLSGEFSGIGAEIGFKQNQLVIVSPLPGTPAERAGLRPGDKILAIDKKVTVGMDASSAVLLIRGPANTTTTLTIGRVGWAKAKDIVIKREKINVPAIIYAFKPGNIAYLRIMQFNDQTPVELDKYIRQLQSAKAKGVIVDLRNNPGGYLESAVSMASEWIVNGRVVSEIFSDGQENVHRSVGLHRLNQTPTVVLVNGGSASASEIVAGALQDNNVATIIGEKTFGKGSVQDYQSLPDGSALKITVAEWYTPKGTNINEKGITPDIIVKEDYEKAKVGDDAMIKKALEILNKKP